MFFCCSKPPSEVDALRYILITLSVVGFTANDLFYIAAIINYSLQCQLITFLINVTVDRICKQQCKIDQAIKVPICVHTSLKYHIPVLSICVYTMST